METVTFNNRTYNVTAKLETTHAKEWLVVEGVRGAVVAIITRLNGSRFMLCLSGRTQEEK